MTTPPSHPEPGTTLTVTTVFTTTEQHQQHLFALLGTNARDVLENTPGFLGSTLTRCDDRIHVIHHARWRDNTALTAMLATPAAQTSMAAVREISTAHVYRASHINQFAPAHTTI